MGNIITIHHECPSKIEISHSRGWNLNQGRGLPSPLLISDPLGEISLFYIDRLIMDCFSHTFASFLVENNKVNKTLKTRLFIHLLYINSEFTSVFIGYENGDVNENCALLITGEHDWIIG